METLVLTGSSGRLGRQIAEVHLQNGWRVIGLDIRDPKVAHKNFQHFECDVGFEGEVESCLSSVGSIESLVNCVASTEHMERTLDRLSIFDWEDGLRTNLTSYFISTKTCLERLRRTRGTIVNVSSASSFLSEQNSEISDISDGAIATLSRLLATRLSPEVRVNCITPSWNPKRKKQSPQGSTEFNIYGRPQNLFGVAELCYYLNSRKTAYSETQGQLIQGGNARKLVYHH